MRKLRGQNDKVYNKAISKINEYNNQKEKIQEERKTFSSIENYVNIMERMHKVKKEESEKKFFLFLVLAYLHLFSLLL